MSKKVKVSLVSPKSKKALSTNSKVVSLGNGECIFPFKYKDTLYKECYPGKKGDWCATKVNKKTREMKSYAYCDYANSNAGVANAGAANAGAANAGNAGAANAGNAGNAGAANAGVNVSRKSSKKAKANNLSTKKAYLEKKPKNHLK